MFFRPLQTVSLAISLAFLAAALAGHAAASEPSVIAVDTAFKLSPPEGWTIEEAPAIVLRGNGNIVLFNRGAHPLLEFDRKGRFVREIGAGLFKTPHGLRIDHDGNLWTTDSGTHLVLRFSPAGEVTMVLGRKDFAGRDWFDRGYPDGVFFDQPLDVGFDAANNIYVVDKGNARIVKFAADGDYLAAWGAPGVGPGQFNFAHSIEIDSADRVFVADRENKRIQIFTTEGDFVEERESVGHPYNLLLDENEALWVTDARAARISQYSADGALLHAYQSLGKEPGEFYSLHGVAIDQHNRLYTSEVWNWRVQRFTLEQQAQ